MLEIEKYIKKHVGRKVLLTLTFSPSPNARLLPKGSHQEGKDRVLYEMVGCYGMVWYFRSSMPGSSLW